VSYDHCQYSNITWLRTDSPLVAALNEAPRKDPSAVITTFLKTLVSAHREFQQGIHPGVDLMKLLKRYQDKTGIISTRNFTLPDVPPGGSVPGMDQFFTDLVEGIVGAASTEAGVAISIYTLVQDLIHILDIQLHVKGLLINNSTSDLEEIELRVGPDGEPNLLPLNATIPGARKIMNPVDKKNYDCVGFVLFGAVGMVSLEGFSIDLRALRERNTEAQMYFQYYTAGLKGVAAGDYENHSPLEPSMFDPRSRMYACLIDGGMLDTVCLFSAQQHVQG
jgi:hypothetical protein